MTGVAQQTLLIISNPSSAMLELSGVLAMDPALAALVLRFANSAYFGLGHPVSTVQLAVAYLGMDTVRSLVLAASMAAVLNRPVPGYGLGRGELWKHSIGVAASARLVTMRFGHKVSEEAYHAGLLADIGKLALDTLLRDESGPGLLDNSVPFHELEDLLFGVDHATLGAEMARRWNLPAPLVDAIRNHHRPAQAREGALLAAAVHVADSAMMTLGIGLGYDGLRYGVVPSAWHLVAWHERSYAEVVQQVVPFVRESEAFLRT